jgi:hypothetical protein
VSTRTRGAERQRASQTHSGDVRNTPGHADDVHDAARHRTGVGCERACVSTAPAVWPHALLRATHHRRQHEGVGVRGQVHREDALQRGGRRGYGQKIERRRGAWQRLRFRRRASGRGIGVVTVGKIATEAAPTPRRLRSRGSVHKEHGHGTAGLPHTRARLARGRAVCCQRKSPAPAQRHSRSHPHPRTCSGHRNAFLVMLMSSMNKPVRTMYLRMEAWWDGAGGGRWWWRKRKEEPRSSSGRGTRQRQGRQLRLRQPDTTGRSHPTNLPNETSAGITH